MARPPRILITAGETSGDRLGAGLARALEQLRPDVELLGMGSRQMQEAGVRIVQDSSEIAVVGIQEVLAHLPAIRAAMSRLETVIRDEQPDLLVPIDFPDFNLRLAGRAKRAGVDVVYFVSPQVWAWRRGRVHQIRRLVRRMLVLFPFETSFYEQAGVPVSFVGHPLAEVGERGRTREELCAACSLDPGLPVIAVVPGSRRSELGHLLTPMLMAAVLVRQARPEMQFLITLAPGLSRDEVEQRAREAGLARYSIHSTDFPEILTICEAGVVTSGTASLEAALTGLPIVVGYRMGSFSYLVGRLLVKLPHIALPNLVAGRGLVPELLQGDCTPEKIAAALMRFLDEPHETQQLRSELAGLRERLGGPGVYERAAREILGELP
jgi:lipid-A-disaccharide synthase